MTFTHLVDTNTFSYIAAGKSRKTREEFYRLTNDPNAQLCISALTQFASAWPSESSPLPEMRPLKA